MIRRGTRLSRLLAVGLVAGPIVLALGGFTVWAGQRWTQAGARIAAEDQAAHDARARATHASFYRALGDAWGDYAATEISGLAQERTAAAAERAMADRVRAVFGRFDAAVETIETLARDGETGVQRLRLEARGAAPEAALAGLLEAIETQQPFLFIDLLEIRPAEAQAEGPATLRLRLRVSSYRIREADR